MGLMRRYSKPWNGCVLGGWLLLSVQYAYADKATDFRKHYDRAISYYEKGAYESALTEYQMAYAIKQLPKLLLNIGQLHRKLGHAKDALGYYELYLRVEPNPEPQLKAELDRYIQQTRAMLDAAERVRGESVVAENRAKSERQQDHGSQVQGGSVGSVTPLPPGSEKPRTEAVNDSGNESRTHEQQTRLTQADAAVGSVSAESRIQTRIVNDTSTEQMSVTSAATIAAQPQAETTKPIYKRGWFWGVIAAVAVAGAGGITAGVLLSNRQPGVPDNIEVQSFLLRY